MSEKSRTVILLPQAQQNLDDISTSSPRIVEEILQKLELLIDFPEIGPTMDQAYQGYRQLLCGHYRIIYEIVSESRIEVAYIRHGSRQLGLRLVD